MVKDKVRQIGQAVKQSVKDTFMLLWQFKWYVGAYLLYYIMFLSELFNPPEKDSLLWGSEAMEGAWNYINQEVYVESLKLYNAIDIFIFLIATSNMRNHPLLAKIIFLCPWICMLLGSLVLIGEWIIKLF